MAEAMGLEDTSFDAFYASICQMLNQLQIPNTLIEIGVPADCAATIAARAIQDSAAATNPRQVTVQEIQSVIETTLNQGR
jgi:alcohol dehydrogenase class IV